MVISILIKNHGYIYTQNKTMVISIPITKSWLYIKGGCEIAVKFSTDI